MNCEVKSVRGLGWKSSEPQEVTIPGIPTEVVSIAVNRNVGDLKEFFNPSLKTSMPDPFVLKDMDKAIERVKEAVINKEKICVFGDYDVDGATSTAIMVRYLRYMGNEVNFYIPDREKEGYGPNVPAIEGIAADGTQLLIVVDSGSLAFEPMKVAKELGMGIVILDHHKAHEEHPEGILVNPNRTDESGDYYYLCAAGMSFLFVAGLQRALRQADMFKDREEYPIIHNLLGIAALGTVADVMDLRGLNRAYVKVGVPLMKNNIGLMALAEANGIDPEDFSPTTCGFVFGPCINASGRIDDTSRGTRLLVTDDPEEARIIAEELVELNKKRKELQRSFETAANEQAKEQEDTNVIVVYDEEWHPGIVGIVASRIKDNFDKSAIVIGRDGKGSCRGIEGFDIGAAVMAAVKEGILLKGGGHAPAAGLTIDPAKMEELREFMRERSKDVERPPLEADLEIPCGKLSTKLIEAFQMLAPFGKGNSKPRVILTEGILTNVKPLKGLHVKGRLSGVFGDTDVIMFNAVGTPIGDTLLASEGCPIELYGEASLNVYMGRVTVQVKPEDIRLPEMLKENAF